eukprot:6178575-Pleurochrysis_carterae.AAC.4
MKGRGMLEASSNTFRFLFTGVRDPKRAEGASLSEVILYDPSQRQLQIAFATSTGNSPSGQGPGGAVDGSLQSKWVDLSLTSNQTSELVIYLEHVSIVSEYRFFTSNDAQKRDPVSWRFEALATDNSFEWILLDERSEVTPPLARQTAYDAMWLHAPPPSPPGPALRLLITETRLPGASETALGEVKLLTARGTARVQSALNPSGRNPAFEGADRAVDGDVRSKWLDANFSSSYESELLLVLNEAETLPVTAYELFTASDGSQRDPSSWTLSYQRAGQSEWVLLHAVNGLLPPLDRSAAYTPTPFLVVQTPSSPPTMPPNVPPCLSPSRPPAISSPFLQSSLPLLPFQTPTLPQSLFTSPLHPPIAPDTLQQSSGGDGGKDARHDNAVSMAVLVSTTSLLSCSILLVCTAVAFVVCLRRGCFPKRVRLSLPGKHISLEATVLKHGSDTAAPSSTCGNEAVPSVGELDVHLQLDNAGAAVMGHERARELAAGSPMSVAKQKRYVHMLLRLKKQLDTTDLLALEQELQQSRPLQRLGWLRKESFETLESVVDSVPRMSTQSDEPSSRQQASSGTVNSAPSAPLRHCEAEESSILEEVKLRI